MEVVLDFAFDLYIDCEYMYFPAFTLTFYSATIILLTIGSYEFTVRDAYVVGDGFDVTYSSVLLSDAAPFVEDERTMVPLRVIAEALGAEVDWEEETGTVILTLGDVVVYLVVGAPLEGDMGTPVIVGERTFVPVRYVSEAFGATVRWDDDTNTVFIYHVHN